MLNVIVYCVVLCCVRLHGQCNYKTASACQNAACYWDCSDASNPCSSEHYTYGCSWCSGSAECTAMLCNWTGSSCYEPFSSCSSYSSASSCQSAGCHWDCSNSTCASSRHSSGCSKCDTSTTCSANRCYWSGVSCFSSSPSPPPENSSSLLTCSNVDSFCREASFMYSCTKADCKEAGSGCCKKGTGCSSCKSSLFWFLAIGLPVMLVVVAAVSVTFGLCYIHFAKKNTATPTKAFPEQSYHSLPSSSQTQAGEAPLQ